MLQPAVQIASILSLVMCLQCLSLGAGSSSRIPYRNLQPGLHAGGLYIYRPPDSATYWTRFFVKWNDRQIGELRAGGYVYVQARPGRYRLSVEQQAPSKHIRKLTLQPSHDVEIVAGRNRSVRFPVVDGVLLRYSEGQIDELRLMRQDKAIFLVPKSTH